MNINEAVQRHLDITAEIKRLSETRDAIGEAIKTEMEVSETKFIVGTDDDHGLKMVETVRWTLNQKQVKEEMGDDWVIAHSRQSLVKSLRLARED